jgi:hypothetical protein
LIDRHIVISASCRSLSKPSRAPLRRIEHFVIINGFPDNSTSLLSLSTALTSHCGEKSGEPASQSSPQSICEIRQAALNACLETLVERVK